MKDENGYDFIEPTRVHEKDEAFEAIKLRERVQGWCMEYRYNSISSHSFSTINPS